MATPGLYRRVLPSPPAIEFASEDGKRIFAEALAQGTMEGFFKLISYYQTQSEPAYCGLATLAVVLNALAIDPGRKWKGPWRWFDDSMLDCCEPLTKIKVEGITFGKVACLARCNGAKVEAFRTNESTIDDFRKHVISCASSEDCHLIVSYHRGAFNQTGTGHFSPLGGYHAERDLVLILDVARFKYPPHWVPLTLLWKGMSTIDEATRHHRGYMIISRLNRAPSKLCTLVLLLVDPLYAYLEKWINLIRNVVGTSDWSHKVGKAWDLGSCRHESWNSVAKYLTEDVPILLKSEDLKDIWKVLSAVFKCPPNELRGFITWIAEVRRQEDGNLTLSEEEKGRLAIKADILEQIRTTQLFKHVSRWLYSEISCCCTNLSKNDKLPALAESVCCQGAELLSGCGRLGLSGGKCSSQINVKHIDADSENPATLVSGTVSTGGSEQGVDVLVPLCQNLCLSDEGRCIGLHPSTADVLTVLLLALPLDTWSGIKEEKLQAEVKSLVNTENLPLLLQEEVLFLRDQLHILMTDIIAPSSFS